MIGDTPYDIESAGKANVGVIALRCGGFSDDTFRVRWRSTTIPRTSPSTLTSRRWAK
jgi:hypothetical protein